jgi:biopolymer transport protein ExbD
MPEHDTIGRTQEAHYRRLFTTRRRFARGPADPVSLVSVGLLVSLFLLLQSQFVVQPGIRVDLPSSPFTSGAPHGPMVVTVSQAGAIFFDDEPVSPDQLKAELEEATFDHPDRPLIVEADGRVPYRRIVDLYNLAAAAGIREILLATRVPSTPP